VFVVDMHGKSVGGRGPPGPAVCGVYCASRVVPQPDLGREMTSWELDGRRMVQKKRGYMAPRSRSTQPFTLCGAVKWVPAKGRWRSAVVRVTAGLTES